MNQMKRCVLEIALCDVAVASERCWADAVDLQLAIASSECH